MPIKKYFTNKKNKLKNNVTNKTQAAKKWFIKSVKKLAGKAIPDGMIDASTMRHPPIGEIALFKYDPKWKHDDKVLPYYDVNPLVLMVYIRDSKNFFGINLHYIPPKMRKKIIEKMVEYKKESGDNPRDYIKKVLPLLEAIGNSDLFGHTYKHYLTDHVRSKFAIVNVDYWEKVSALPLQDFKKQSQQKVWQDAQRIKSKKARKWGM